MSTSQIGVGWGIVTMLCSFVATSTWLWFVWYNPILMGYWQPAWEHMAIRDFFLKSAFPYKNYGFISRLESLRGLAAVMVAVHHCLKIFLVAKTPLPLDKFQFHLAFWLHLLFAGSSAVILFFVHSGLVLGLSLDKSRDVQALPRWAGFWMRRIFRLYPMQIFTILLSLVYVTCFFHTPHYIHIDHWFEKFFRHTPTLLEVVQNCLLASSSMSGVTWSLCVEAIVSVLFPLLYVFNRKGNGLLDLALLGGFLFLSFKSAGISDEYAIYRNTLQFLYVFYLGLSIPKWGPTVFSMLTHKVVRVALSLGALFLFFGYQFVTPNPFLQVVVRSFSATWLIASVVYYQDSPMYGFLDRALPTLFGKICYSFYLMHFITLYITAWLFMDYAPAWLPTTYPLACNLVMVLISVPIATGLGYCCNHLIEEPLVRFGKRLVTRLCPAVRKPVKEEIPLEPSYALQN